MIRNSDTGFTLIELLIVITIIGLLAALAWPLYSQYLQSSRQTAAMAQMRAIGDANELYWTRNQGYAPTLDDLEPNFMRRVPSRDPWGNPYAYVVENGVYRLTSLGSDGNPGPQPPPDWRDEPYEPDIVLEGGVFMQAPGVDAE